MPELLLELFSEEIPARMQAKAGADLQRLMLDGLKAAGAPFGAARVFWTPRRLTLVVDGVGSSSPATREEFKGPRSDAPEKALAGFLRKVGLEKEQLELRDDKKGQVYFAVVEKPARRTLDILSELTPEVIRTFPWPKSMRWGAGELRWVRPLRSILCLLSDGEKAEIAPFEVGGVASGDIVYGHRFLDRDRATGGARPHRVANFAEYQAALTRAKVLLDPEARAQKIERDAAKAAAAAGLELAPDPGLLREVAGLVEHPVAILGDIDPAFQTLPPEVLQTSMREHQKFFAAREPVSGNITKFVTIANIAARDKGENIRAGNERVLRARLADARFFYENDLRAPLETNVEKLKAVTFHNQIGDQAARVARIRSLARALAPVTGADPEQADRAALLAKADLVSEMVFEFPELQGLMGRYYAEAAGEPKPVAEAIEAHYAPLGPSDAPPKAPVSMTVALADKLDMLAAFWAIGAKPTGSGDPYSLRRAALGVIRITLDNGLRFRLGAVLAAHAPALRDLPGPFPEGAEGSVFGPVARADLVGFIADRLKNHLRDHGVRHDVIDAVFRLAKTTGEEQDDLVLAKRRIDALAPLAGSEDGANLLAAHKRANNILVAEEAKDGVEYGLDPEPSLAEADEEKALFQALDAADLAIRPAIAAEDFPAAMAAMARLRGPLDAFFDHVVVNAENAILRRNRLCLLNRIRATMGQVADFGALEG